MFGIMINDDTITGEPKPFLIGISTTIPNQTEVYGTNISVGMAVIKDDYGVRLSLRLNPKGLKTATTAMPFGAPEGPAQ